jgi:hypothetical protein
MEVYPDRTAIQNNVLGAKSVIFRAAHITDPCAAAPAVGQTIGGSALHASRTDPPCTCALGVRP